MYEHYTAKLLEWKEHHKDDKTPVYQERYYRERVRIIRDELRKISIKSDLGEDQFAVSTLLFLYTDETIDDVLSNLSDLGKIAFILSKWCPSELTFLK
ncbi:MAG: hypothetical protein EOP45_17895 [Sphingobacteriaceae bacterium]|nr:MAG: hypothetical protein EOP45_17895 [Sphingobacteriaceae bacterium]